MAHSIIAGGLGTRSRRLGTRRGTCPDESALERRKSAGMNTTEPLRAPQTSEEPSFGDELTEFMPWFAAFVVLGPITFLVLMLWAPFLVLVAVVVVPALVASLLALGAAVLALPFLLVRHLHQRIAERRRSAEGSTAIAGTMAQAGGSQ